jgi:hypothetical protein
MEPTQPPRLSGRKVKLNHHLVQRSRKVELYNHPSYVFMFSMKCCITDWIPVHIACESNEVTPSAQMYCSTYPNIYKSKLINAMLGHCPQSDVYPIYHVAYIVYDCDFFIVYRGASWRLCQIQYLKCISNCTSIERGPLSLVSTIKELLETKSSGSGLERDPSR